MKSEILAQSFNMGPSNRQNLLRPLPLCCQYSINISVHLMRPFCVCFAPPNECLCGLLWEAGSCYDLLQAAVVNLHLQ